MNDIRLYGRRRCSNCYWCKDSVCWFQTYYISRPYITEDTSWCPDWYSRKRASKEGERIEDYIKRIKEK